MKVIATLEKTTKGFHKYTSRQEGTIITAYLPKDKVANPPQEACTITVTFNAAQENER
jgi:hypothetical protein